MEIRLDEGFLFGLGAFETIAVYKGHPVFLREHLERMERTLEFLEIPGAVTEEEVRRYLRFADRTVEALKIAVSQENRLFLPRKNPYTRRDRKRGFTIDLARARRNEDSPFTFHKTMNYGDCILEKRKAKARGLDEVVFLNRKGDLCEGTVSNLFLVREGRIYTPARACGLLPGILRGYILENWEVTETRIPSEEISSFEECFLSNSLMGIMPVRRFGEHCFAKRETAERIWKKYAREMERQTEEAGFLSFR